MPPQQPIVHLRKSDSFMFFGLAFPYSVFRLFVQGSQSAFGVFSNMPTYPEFYIPQMKTLLVLKLTGALLQTACKLIPSAAFEAETSTACSRDHVMVPMDKYGARIRTAEQHSRDSPRSRAKLPSRKATCEIRYQTFPATSLTQTLTCNVW